MDVGTGGLTVDPRHGPSQAPTNGVCSHDDAAQVMRRTSRPDTGHIGPNGW